MAARDQRQVPQASLADVLAEAPARNEGRFGRPGDPWNLLFIGARARVAAALSGAGWIRVACSIPLSLAHGLGDLLRLKRLERFPPMNRYTIGGRVQDMNWAQVVTPITKRHHFRLWDLGRVDARGRRYWWGSGNYDKDARYWDLSHVPDPDMDMERDYIAHSLENSPHLESLDYAPCPRIPRAGANDKGYAFENDGRVLVAVMRPDDEVGEP